MDIAEILESGIPGLSSVTEITILTFKNVTSILTITTTNSDIVSICSFSFWFWIPNSSSEPNEGPNYAHFRNSQTPVI